jgi:signal transduction histidine kinase
MPPALAFRSAATLSMAPRVSDNDALVERRRQVAHQTHQVPALRLLTVLLLAMVVLVHNLCLLETFSPGSYFPFLASGLLYALVSWWLLLRFYDRSVRVDLGTLFLILDLFWFAYAIRVSGSDRSWLMFLPLVRVADQVSTTFRRVLLFVHLSTAAYLAVPLAQTLIDHHPPRWSMELAKTSLIYLAGSYLATTARSAERLRTRSTRSDGVKRTLMHQLRAQKRLLDRARSEAQQSARAKGTFLANVGHELRTPLQSVLGFIDLTLDTQVTAEQRGYLDVAHGSARKLQQLLDHLVDLSRLEGRTLQLTDQPFPLAELLEGLEREIAPEAAAKGLAVAFTIAPALRRELRGDPIQLRHVLMGLLRNGIKFTAAGSVALTARSTGQSDRQLQVEFCVRDTGIGIAPQQQELIFDAFSQVESAANRRHEGAGLGLALARRMVDLMHGRLWVESQLGQGAAFFVTVQLATGDPLAPSDVSRPAAGV